MGLAPCSARASLLAALLTAGCSSGNSEANTPPRATTGAVMDSGPTCTVSCSGSKPAPDAGDLAIGGDDSGTVAGGSMADGDEAGALCEPTCNASSEGTSGNVGWLGDWGSGDYPPGDITAQNYLTISGVKGQQGNDRQYKVHVPPSYSPATPMPVLFCLHGLFQNAVMFCLDTGVAWNTKSDAEGFILVMPNGYQNSWNGGTCCGAAATAGLDDVSLIRAIFAEVSTHLNVDPHRVYATGLSNGGYLSYRLACEASDIFVAIAPAAGAVGTTLPWRSGRWPTAAPRLRHPHPSPPAEAIRRV
jgi:Esterase PHB depolymerase